MLILVQCNEGTRIHLDEQNPLPCALRSASTVARVGELANGHVDAVQASVGRRLDAGTSRAERDRGIAARVGLH
jgi:hypothetical protein